MGPKSTAAEVRAVVQHSPLSFSLLLTGSLDLASTQPGQFVMVQISERLEPYLRRPFSVHNVTREPGQTQVELLGKVVGRGTQILSQCRVGDRLSLLGPFGRPFMVVDQGPVALVAGGVGSAALFLLARQLVAAGLRFDFYYGGHSAADLARREEFAALSQRSGGRLVLTTEDGSLGERGRITEPLEAPLLAGQYHHLYACGPRGLLERLAELVQQSDIRGQAALETPMGCGFGACLGCAVPHTSGRYALCCTDGPVFFFDEVVW